VLASFDVVVSDLAGLVDGLARKVAAIHASGIATVMVGVGFTLFDDRAVDPDGQLTPLDAHIRRADPRTPGSRRHRILRCSYSYRRGDDEGLVFICFQRDPESGFATVQRRRIANYRDYAAHMMKDADHKLTRTYGGAGRRVRPSGCRFDQQAGRSKEPVGPAKHRAEAAR